jgi:hypothetical protein
MKRLWACSVAVLLLSVLVGCASSGRYAIPVAIKVASPLPKTARLAAGQHVVMPNGLKFVVPAGWEGTSTIYPASVETSGGPWGTRGASQYVVLHHVGLDAGPPSEVTLTSWQTTQSQAPPSNVGTLTKTISQPAAQLLQGRWYETSPPSYLYVVQTEIAGAQAGTIVIVDSHGEAVFAVGQLPGLLHMEGFPLAPPPGWRFDD